MANGWGRHAWQQIFLYKERKWIGAVWILLFLAVTVVFKCSWIEILDWFDHTFFYSGPSLSALNFKEENLHQNWIIYATLERAEEIWFNMDVCSVMQKDRIMPVTLLLFIQKGENRQKLPEDVSIKSQFSLQLVCPELLHQYNQQLK